MLPVTVIILAHNEEIHIRRSIQSCTAFAEKVYVVDSFSTDQTVPIAKEVGAEVVQHAFENYARQFQWALDNLKVDSPWVMRLDADEVVESDLAQEMLTRLTSLDPDIVAINLKRKHYFWGRWIKYGGRFPLVLTRVWRRGHARIEERWMDEHMVISGGRTVTFNGGFRDENLKDLSFFTAKHNSYATREAVDVLNSKYNLFPTDSYQKIVQSGSRAALKRIGKERVYNYLPFPLASLLYFIWRYIFQLGVLDGGPGLVYHFLQGFWYRFLVGAKVCEYERSIDFDDKARALVQLQALTGLALVARGR